MHHGAWCAVFINLARRADRRARLARTLSAGNSALMAKLERIDAVDGRRIDLADAELCKYVSPGALERAREAKRASAFTIVHQEGQLVKFHDHLTEGGIACAMSHRAAVEHVASHPTAEWGLILEDDIACLVPRADKVISRVLRRLPSDWDAVFLGYHGGALAGTGGGGKDTFEEEVKARWELSMDASRGRGDGFEGSVDGDAYCAEGPYDPPVLRMFAPLYGLYAWAVSKRAARAVLSEGAFPVDGQVDYAMSQWLQQRGQSFKVAPRHLLFFSPKSEDGLDSDIQTMARLDELLQDEEACNRYLDFLEAEPQAAEDQ